MRYVDLQLLNLARIAVLAEGVPGPVWGFCGALAAAIVAGAVSMWNTRRLARSAERATSGSVDTADAKVVFEQQIATFKMSEELRVAMSVQLQRCQVEIAELKDERDKMAARLRKEAVENEEQLNTYRERLQTLEREMEIMAERLRKEVDKNGRGKRGPDDTGHG